VAQALWPIGLTVECVVLSEAGLEVVILEELELVEEEAF